MRVVDWCSSLFVSLVLYRIFEEKGGENVRDVISVKDRLMGLKLQIK